MSRLPSVPGNNPSVSQSPPVWPLWLSLSTPQIGAECSRTNNQEIRQCSARQILRCLVQLFSAPHSRHRLRLHITPVIPCDRLSITRFLATTPLALLWPTLGL